MDLWLIAATAATGYIGKCLQNVSQSKHSFEESSSDDFSNVKSKSHRCLANILVKGKKPKGENFEASKIRADGDNPEIQVHDNAYGVDVPSTSGGRESLGDHKDIHSDSLFGDSTQHEGQNLEICNIPVDERQTYHLTESLRNRTFHRRNQRYRRLVKPLNSLESCFMTQFHREQMGVKDYMLSPFPSPCGSTTRPLLVTDGARVINGNIMESLSGQIQNEISVSHVHGIPPLTTRSKSSVASNKMRNGDGTALSHRHVDAHGTSDAAFVLCMGITIGIMSSFLASRTEVDALRKELKQTENLVQDLQDELEMKDSLTVRELENENMKKKKKGNGERERGQNAESMRKIEAELEAELERLEFSINTSNVKPQLSDMIDLDPDYEVDFAESELRADGMERQAFTETDSNEDPSGNSTPESGNYTVSPRELSLRLHEIIHSRLEEQIKELETALQESERKVEQLQMQSERKQNPWSRLWESNEVVKHETDGETRVPMVHTVQNPEPLVMNLAGEALDAYNDVYDELMKINEDSEEDDSPGETFEDKNTHWVHKNYMKGSSRTEEEDNLVRVQELVDVEGLSEEEEEEESEMEKELIKQIVEKTKQGSPVVLNAQKMLFLMEEDREHPYMISNV